MSNVPDEENQRELRQRHLGARDDSDVGVGVDIAYDEKSPGVRRIEAITSLWTRTNKIWFVVALVLFTYTRTLAAYVLGTYFSFALNAFGEAGNSGMVKTVRQVLASAALPVTAKLSDYMGRGFILNCTVLFWVVGTIVAATSSGLAGYLPGFLIYTLGNIAGDILSYALSIDTTTMRNRLFLQACFVFPSIINIWAGGVIANEVLNGPGWQWGIGMWAIIIPPFAVGLYVVLGRGSLKARRLGLLEGIPSPWALFRSGKHWKHMFWVMDVPGLFLLAAGLALILLPLSLGGSSAAKWRTAGVIVPLVIGVLCLPAFVLWEVKWARHPIFPVQAMKDRHVVFILLIHFLNSIAMFTRDAYLYFTLLVSFNQGIEGATRIYTLPGFSSSITVLVVAFLVRRFRIVKPFVIAGCVLGVVAQGMHINFRGGYSTSQLAGVVAGEVIEGIGSGLSGHPSLVAMQAKLSHEHALLITACWDVSAQAGAGIASAVAGGIWNSLMPGKLERGLEAAGIPNAKKVAVEVFRQPLNFIRTNPPGSVGRDAVMFAYRDVMKILGIVAVCLCGVSVILSCFIDNIRLDERHNLVEEKGEKDSSTRPPSSQGSENDKDVQATEGGHVQ